MTREQLMHLNAIMKWLGVRKYLLQIWGYFSRRGFEGFGVRQSWLLCQQKDHVLGNGSTGIMQMYLPSFSMPSEITTVVELKKQEIRMFSYLASGRALAIAISEAPCKLYGISCCVLRHIIHKYRDNSDRVFILMLINSGYFSLSFLYPI